MKKNLLTIITFALVLVNIVLTSILTITIMPEVKKVNELVTRICDAIDLDLQAATGAESTENVSLENVESYNLPDSLTINLKPGADGATHYGVVSITLSINKKSESYETYGANITGGMYDGIISDTVNSTIAKYTYEEITADQSAVQREIKNELNAKFGSNLIVNVGFSKVTFS
ncbi:MAG: flagellar basal body-associated FliL family protein [Lachnospiraceae bacterium]|jgi:flagellar FliL protein|nr:flagellar basal body-associated FliL family protein [Lachnospiraceae bacterium]SFT42836.1 Flagellar basal body-associated protein FliL [Lachnospiraceae bacterium XBD2001]